MGTIYYRSLFLIKKLGVYILSRKKLLLAAVILFGFSLFFQSPETLSYISYNSDLIITKTSQEESSGALAQKTYLAKNAVLASIVEANETDDSDFFNDDATQEDSLPALDITVLLNQARPLTIISQSSRQEIITYAVKEGDTASSIAASFGINTNTLLWANKLTEKGLLKIGDELKILPTSGVLHRIKDGDTVDKIAKYYKTDADDIIAFNSLPADGVIQIGQDLIVPDGQMPAPARPKTIVKRTNLIGPGTGKSRLFPWGQCTWYIAQKRYVPWSGHAKSWLANAAAHGFPTGQTPQVGSIMVLRGGGRYGHVVYVEAINDPWITFSEMNFEGLGVLSVRTINKDDPKIRGYIY